LINGVKGMGAKNADDIMAECLLAGGKMLSRACRDCGSPLFEVKGETLCVVCREKGKEAGRGAAIHTTTPVPAAVPAGAGAAGGAPAPGQESEEERELRLTIAVLARRAREETDPDRSRALMEAARNAALALSLLQR
jgi:UPF0148 protein